MKDLRVYGRAHGGILRIFNDLGGSYDQAHGGYAQAHAAKMQLQCVTQALSAGYVTIAIFVNRVYGNGFMVSMVLMENHGSCNGQMGFSCACQ